MVFLEVKEKQRKIENKKVVLLIKYLVKEQVLHLNHQEEAQEIVHEEVLGNFDNIPLNTG